MLTGRARIVNPACGKGAPTTLSLNDEVGSIYTRMLLERPAHEPTLPPLLRAPSMSALLSRGVPEADATAQLDLVRKAQHTRAEALRLTREARADYVKMIEGLGSSRHVLVWMDVPEKDFDLPLPSEAVLGKRRAE